jgi:ferredoxin
MADDFVERKFGDLTVRIDRSTCIASANCMVVAPDHLDLDEDSVVRFTDGSGEIDRDTVIEACRVCPVDALFVFDAEGKQIVP